MTPDWARCQRQLGYTFRDPAWLHLAFTHRSCPGRDNNERLEFLGDGLLNFIIADQLYVRFPQEDEGRLTRLRATLVREPTLAEIARSLQLGDFLQMGTGELRTGGFRKASILADTVEAVIGAIYRDGAPLEVITERVVTWYGAQLRDIRASEGLKDPKSRLQEWLQRHRRPLPIYTLIDTLGDGHEQTFITQCQLDEGSCFTGRGTSRRLAEQGAAEAALLSLLPAQEKSR